MTILLNNTGNPISRDERNKINENWQRIIDGLTNLQMQIKVLAGGQEVDELIVRLEKAIESAETDLQNYIEQINSTVQDAIDKNNTATQQAIDKNNTALQASLGEVSDKLQDLSTAITNAETATLDTTNAKNSAIQATQDAQNAISNMQSVIDNTVHRGEWNSETQYFKNNMAVYNGSTFISLQDNLNKVPPTLPTQSNTYWSLFAEKGDKGSKGEKGDTGAALSILGKLTDPSQLPPTGQAGQAYTVNGELYVWSENLDVWENVGNIKGEKGDTGATGEDGKSAYEVAVVNGFVGTQEEWLASLKGEKGDKGQDADLTEVNQEIANLQQSVTNNQQVVTEHLGQDVLSEDGAHGIRFFNDQLAVKDKDNQDQWNVVELGGSGEVYQENVTMNDKANALGYATFAGSVTYVSRNGYVNPATNQIVVVDSTGLATGDSIILKYNTGALENATITEMTAIDAKGVSTITVSTTAVLSQNITHIMKLGGTDTIQMAEGYSTVASGKYSHAEGSYTTARGQRSHAEGYATTAKGDGSHAEGNSTFAAGSNSHAEGQSSIASGSSSHAEGTTTLATGANSHAEGNNTEATSANAHAEGSGTKATGHTSHAEGGYTIAAGQSSHAEGNGSYANGNYSHAEGANTIAFGESSHAEGDSTTAEGSHSHAEGLGTLAGVFASHAQGRYNKQMTGLGTSVVQTDDAFVIGNGFGPTGRGNAFRVRFNGSTYGVGAWNSTGADYAEFFEWLDGNVDVEDRVGFVVTLEGDKIRKATADDSYILGIISANPSVIGDSHQDDWNNKYVTDEWGRIQYHWIDVEYEELEVTGDGAAPKKITKTRQDYVPILNPDWNNDEEYIPREQRREWDTVGLIGKLLVRDDGSCEVNNYAKVGAEEGTLTASNERTDMRVIERVAPNIVRVFIK